jgi:hypothetical protein
MFLGTISQSLLLESMTCASTRKCDACVSLSSEYALGLEVYQKILLHVLKARAFLLSFETLHASVFAIFVFNV